MQKCSWPKIREHEALLFHSGGLSALGRGWVGCVPWPQAVSSTTFSPAGGSEVCFSPRAKRDEGRVTCNLDWWRQEGHSAGLFCACLSLSSARKWWRRLWVGFEVLEPFLKVDLLAPSYFLSVKLWWRLLASRGMPAKTQLLIRCNGRIFLAICLILFVGYTAQGKTGWLFSR